MIQTSQHPEIIEQLKALLNVSKSFKKYEASLGRDAVNEKKRLSPGAYYQKILTFNAENRGTLKKDIQSIVHRLGAAKPEFNTIEGMSRAHLEEFVKVTAGASPRMNDQLTLAKILEVKDLFKYESDIFQTKKISRVEALLKEMK